MIVVLLATPLGAQARMRCAPEGQPVGGLPSSFAQYRFDVVPCFDDERNRSGAESQSADHRTADAGPLIDWIVIKTGWTAREVPPIRFVPYAELEQIFTGGKRSDLHVEALYSDKDHAVYLPDTWRADDLRDRSILLHELVHHLQYLNKVKTECPSEFEWQAVELQIEWLQEQGVEDPLEFLGISPLFILMLRRCE